MSHPHSVLFLLEKDFPKWSTKDIIWVMHRMNLEGLCYQGSGRNLAWALRVKVRPYVEKEYPPDPPARTRMGGAVFLWNEEPVPKKKRYSKRTQRRVA